MTWRGDLRGGLECVSLGAGWWAGGSGGGAEPFTVAPVCLLWGRGVMGEGLSRGHGDSRGHLSAVDVSVLGVSLLQGGCAWPSP